MTLTRREFVRWRNAGIAGAYGYDTGALVAMFGGDYEDAQIMDAAARFSARYGRRLTATPMGRRAAATEGLTADEALRAGL